MRVLALLLATHVLAAQQPVYRSAVDLVTLDVIVVDKDGHPITGLKPEDFVVTLDGKARPIRALNFIETGAARSAGTDSAPVAGRSAGPGAPAARTVLILFDDLSYKPGPGRGLIEAALRLLPSFGADDFIGLATTSGLGPTVNPTRDHATVAAALQDKALVGRYDDTAAPFYIGIDEALEIERGIPKQTLSDVIQRECQILMPAGPKGGADEVCPHMVEAAARRLAQTTVSRTEIQLAAYEAAIAALKSGPAPRVIVALSAGLGTTAARGELQRQLDPVTRAASDAGVEFYALCDVPDGADVGDLTLERARARRAESRFLSDGIQTVTSAAGGETFLVSGTADRFFRRIQSETSGFYRLGVELPDAHPSQRYLRVKVSVARPGAVVRAHTNAIAPGVAAAASVPLLGKSIEDRLLGALEQGDALFGVPISLTSALRRDPDPAGQLQVAVGVQVPASVGAPLTAMYAVVDEIGHIVKEAHARVAHATPGEDYLLAFPIALDPGVYKLRFAVGDAGGAIGLVEHPIAARLARLGSYSASELLTTWTDRAGASRFLALDTLPEEAASFRVALELYPEDPAARDTGLTVRFSLTPIGGESPIVTRTLLPARNGQALSVVADIPARALGAGSFVIRATVMQDGEPVGDVTTSIRKTTPSGPR